VITKLQIFARLSVVNLLIDSVNRLFIFAGNLPIKSVCQTLSTKSAFWQIWLSGNITSHQKSILNLSCMSDRRINGWYKVFGRNYLVHLRPFGRSCKAMKHIMNKQLARRVTIHEKQTSTTMIAQILTTLTTSV